MMEAIETKEGEQEKGHVFTMDWDDAYRLMFYALQCNYKIDSEQCNNIGLLREEHAKDIFRALAGVAKKKLSTE